MANPPILSNEMADRRDHSLSQTKLSGGRYPTPDLSSSSEYDGDSHGGGLLCDGVSGIEDEVKGISPTCGRCGKTGIRNTGFSLLCLSRWHSGVPFWPSEGLTELFSPMG